MVRNTNWIRIGALSAVLMGTVVTGCTNQNSNPDNTPSTPTTTGNTTTSAPQTNSPGRNMSDDNMPGKHPGPNGTPMSGGGMGNNMGGTGRPTDAGKHPGPNNMPMSGGGMGGNR